MICVWLFAATFDEDHMTAGTIHHTRALLRCAVIALGLAFAGGAAHAVEASYVPASRTAGLQLLAAPAASGSEQAVRERAALKQIELARSKEQVARAQADEVNVTMFLFADVVGAGFNAGALPRTALLSEHVGRDVAANTEPLKKTYARMRPYNADKSLAPACRTKTKDDSYPSSHSTAGYLEALTLVELLPEKRDAILARADDYALNRLVCGVHYPSDIEAGKLLAYAVHALMREQPDYQRDVAAARAELRAALGLANSAP
jgi:acid phosphatase (class A)